MTTSEFDDLADDYDASRPRYPAELFTTIAELAPRGTPLTVVDAGAGTGIALEGLVPALHDVQEYLAVDVSEGMVAAGQAKFPEVTWLLTEAEPFLESLGRPVHVVVAAQAYNWLDRERFVRAALGALAPGGLLAILQNNRDHAGDPFLSAYEDLLEERSPGYTRGYRVLDVAGELAAQFVPAGGQVHSSAVTWTRPMSVDDFVQMAASSAHVQRAVAVDGAAFLDRVRALAAAHTDDGRLALPYRSELFVGQAADASL